MAHAAHAEAERVQRVFAALDLPQLLRRHFVMIRNPRRQARGRRLVPHGQPGEPRLLSNLGFRHAGFVERAPHAELLRGDAARPVVAAIVRVGAVGHVRETALVRKLRQPRVELVLAEVAAVLGIRAVLGAFDLAGEDDFVVQVELARDSERELAVVFRITGALGGHAQDVVAEHVRRGPGQIRTVDAAAEGDDDRAHVERESTAAQASLVPVLFLLGLVLLLDAQLVDLGFFFFLVVVIVVVIVVAGDVEFDRRDACDFETRAALWTAEEVAFVHVVLVDFNLCVTLGADSHLFRIISRT